LMRAFTSTGVFTELLPSDELIRFSVVMSQHLSCVRYIS
jgi:hypothetical protein